MISRRGFLRGLGRFGLGAIALSSYAVLIEPLLRQRVTQYDLKLRRWPAGLDLSIAVIADLHACEPWMSAQRIESIVAQTNALGADLIVLLGDYSSGHRFVTERVQPEAWSKPLFLPHRHALNHQGGPGHHNNGNPNGDKRHGGDGKKTKHLAATHRTHNNQNKESMVKVARNSQNRDSQNKNGNSSQNHQQQQHGGGGGHHR